MFVKYIEMYIEKASEHEFGIHANIVEIENIYRGLFLAMNQEQDQVRKTQMRKQIKDIEHLIPEIEF